MRLQSHASSTLVSASTSMVAASRGWMKPATIHVSERLLHMGMPQEDLQRLWSGNELRVLRLAQARAPWSRTVQLPLTMSRMQDRMHRMFGRGGGRPGHNSRQTAARKHTPLIRIEVIGI
ncbi:MAG: hypothetical protein ABIT36_04915 [Steroidobacteraceae bacterium]